VAAASGQLVKKSSEQGIPLAYQELAARLKKPQSFVSAYERGQRHLAASRFRGNAAGHPRTGDPR
jgi:predicted transcriptional regulator